VLDPMRIIHVLQPGIVPARGLYALACIKDGKPFLVFSVQGGDTQDQNLPAVLLNVVEFA